MIYNLLRAKRDTSETWVLNETVNVRTLVNDVCEPIQDGNYEIKTAFASNGEDYSKISVSVG